MRVLLNARTSLMGLLLVAATGTILVACSDDGDSSNPAPTPQSDASTDTSSNTDGGLEGSTDDSSADSSVDSAADGAPSEASTDAAADASPDTSSDTSSDVSSDEYTVYIGSGMGTSCALSNKGRVKCWGDNVEGEMLTAPVPGSTCYQYNEEPPSIECDPRAPTDLALPFPVLELSVGHLNVCAIFNDAGTKKLGCWGNNDRGELTSAAAKGTNVKVVWIDLPAQPKHIAAGRNFKLAWLDDGTIWAWGKNASGQIGAPSLDDIDKPVKVFPFSPPTDADGGLDGTVDTGTILAMATASVNTFVLTSNGLYGVGDNTTGELMLPTSTDEYHSFVKLPVPSGTSMAALHTGCARAYGQCYVTTDGKAFCWGDNDTGQISNALEAVVEAPTQIALPAGKKVLSIAQGAGQVCGLLDDGTVYCWGQNLRGECGKAASKDPVDPGQVPGLADVAMIAPGYWYYTCALTKSHKTYCWGDGSFGQFGKVAPAATGATSESPVEVPLNW